MAEDHFGDAIAARYDESVTEMFSESLLGPAVDFLVEMAGSGAALELGIGTGRIALPLAQRGVPLHGIDLSDAMVRRLREKPGGTEIPVTIGDFATTTVDRRFSLVYLVFNTIMNLTTSDEQVACFQNAAGHLQDGGRFVLEVGVPQLQRLPPGETVRAFDVSASHFGFDEYDTARQTLISHHFTLEKGQFELRSIPCRYAWPSELDLMARLAGLTLSERWASWSREPFTSESAQHVSVWEKRVIG